MNRIFTFVVLFAVLTITSTGRSWHSHHSHGHDCHHQHDDDGWHSHGGDNFTPNSGEQNWPHYNDYYEHDYNRPNSWGSNNHHHHHQYPNNDWNGNNGDPTWTDEQRSTSSTPTWSQNPTVDPSPTTPFPTSTANSGLETASELSVDSRASSIEACIRSCSLTSEFQPLCGSDYQNYVNMGHFLCARECGADIRIFLRRQCPSLDAPTSAPIVAPKGVTGAAAVRFSKVQCISYCPYSEENNPVCGSDDLTYDNPAMLLCAQMCGYDVKIKSTSACDALNNPTSSPDLFRTTPMSFVSSSCINSCPSTAEYNPVCGTNDVTYTNPSQLKCANLCGLDIEIKWRGSCAQGNNNANNNQPPIPTVEEQRPFRLPFSVQQCINSCLVTNEYQPVCGTNGITYPNPGQLQCDKSCGINVDLMQNSPCPPNTNNNDFNTNNPETTTSTTIRTTTSREIADCIFSCPQKTSEFNPICGTNGFTYQNPSHLSCAQACGVSVDVKRRSACPKPIPVSQPFENQSMTAITSQQPPLITTTENTIDINGVNNGADVFTTRPTQLQFNNRNPVPDDRENSTIPSEILLSIFNNSATTTTTETDEEADLDPRFGEEERSK